MAIARRPRLVQAKPVAPLSAYCPQLASQATAPPQGEMWLHELMRGGLRMGCTIQNGQARLFDDQGHDGTNKFPELVKVMQRLPVHAGVFDGEIVLLLPDGRTSVGGVERAVAGGHRHGLTYFLFDLLHLDGKDLTSRPLEDRKRALESLLTHAPSPALRYADHIIGNGDQVYAQACALGVAGIVSKHRRAPYGPKAPGANETWLQVHCAPVRESRAPSASKPASARSKRPSHETQPEANAKQAPHVAGVRITTPNRPVFPALGVTKRDLALYYADVADRMLAYVARRPLTLVRCERGVTRSDGLRSECKFLRHGAGWHRWVQPPIERVLIPEQKKVGEYLFVDSREALVSLVQGDILEIHVWNSTIDHLETPDRFVLDIDPGPDVSWP